MPLRQEFRAERHSSTGRGVIFLGTVRCDSGSHTIVMGHKLFNGGLSRHHVIGDAGRSLDVLGNGNLRIDEALEGGQFAIVQSKTYSADFDQSMHNREQAGGFGVKGQKVDIGKSETRNTIDRWTF